MLGWPPAVWTHCVFGRQFRTMRDASEVLPFLVMDLTNSSGVSARSPIWTVRAVPFST